tara:strand:+ start:13849 stop:14847 length:999 start_codon:yes stop_codon:yes gene_type:complete
MNEWLKLSKNRRLEILKQVNNQTGLPMQAIEKDWWVTIVLKAIFTSQYALHFVFKGGTSLSKAYSLIDRFSEDIDLAIDRSFLGFEGELSNTQIKKLRKVSGNFIINEFREELHKRLQELGIPPETYTLITDENIDDTSDPHTLELEYKTIVEQGDYLAQRVLIEIGARSLLEPSEERTIKSIINEVYDTQKFVMDPFKVNVVIPTRTFLEKAFLLHEEFLKPTEKIRYDRLTRHLYDLERLMDHPFGLEAIKDKELFQIIVNHRTRYTPVRGISYDLHTHKTLNFIPPPEVIERWKNDYQAMRVNMFYGQTLEFEALIERLNELKSRFNEQ